MTTFINVVHSDMLFKGLIFIERIKNASKKNVMSEQEKAEWDALYEYVRSDIMGYDKNQSLSISMVLRLKGLSLGKYMENKNIENKSNYSFRTLLLTFKFCSQNIKQVLLNNVFKDENHKFNYILKIVEKNINDVYLRLQKAKKSQHKLEAINLDALQHEGAGYTPTSNKLNPKLEDIW